MTSRDEYPFARSLEGGFYLGSYARVETVPEKENFIQAGSLSALGLKPGDKLIVIPIDRKGQMPKEFVSQLQQDNKYDILVNFINTLSILISKESAPIPLIPNESLLPPSAQPIFNIGPLN